MQARLNTERREWQIASVDAGIDRVDDDNGLGKERARRLARLLHDNPAEFEALVRSWQDDSSSDNMASSFVFGLINGLGQDLAQQVLQSIPSDVKQRLIDFLADGSVHDDERSAIAILEQSKAENLAPITTEVLDQSDWDLQKAQSSADGVKDSDWPHSKEQAKEWLRQYHDDPLSFINNMRMTGYDEDFDRAAMYFVYGLHDALGTAKAREVIDRLPADVKRILIRHLTQDNVYNREQSAAEFVSGSPMLVSSQDDSDEQDGFFGSLWNGVTSVAGIIDDSMQTAFKYMGPLGSVLEKVTDTTKFFVRQSVRLGEIGFYLATLQFDKAGQTAREGFNALVERIYDNLPLILSAIPVVGPGLAIAYAVGRTAYYAAKGDIWTALESALGAIPAGSGVLGKVVRYAKVGVAATHGTIAVIQGRYRESLDLFGSAVSRSGTLNKVSILQAPTSLETASATLEQFDPAFRIEEGMRLLNEPELATDSSEDTEVTHITTASKDSGKTNEKGLNTGQPSQYELDGMIDDMAKRAGYRVIHAGDPVKVMPSKRELDMQMLRGAAKVIYHTVELYKKGGVEAPKRIPKIINGMETLVHAGLGGTPVEVAAPADLVIAPPIGVIGLPRANAH